MLSDPKYKVLLINPWQGEIYPPPAIGYLQAMLKRYDVNVIARDLDDALALPDEFDLVGVTFHSFSVRYARLIREHFKKSRLICGGHHPSAMPEQMIAIGYDQVVVGEGEIAIMDIINGDHERIKTDSKNKFNCIDEIPFPDYSGLKYSENIVISSRGCPFRCNFCASSAFWHNTWTPRSAENVVGEIKENHYQTWMFEDDNFTANKSRAIEICKNIYGSWQCASRAESLDDELCRFLKLSGCHTIWIGAESFSQASLERCNKNTNIDRMIRGIEIAERYGIRTVCQFIIGLPGDTIEDIKETARIIRKTKISMFGSNIAWVLPSTEIYRKAKEYGMNDDIYLESGAPFYTYEHPMEELLQWQKMINGAKN